MTFAPPNRVIEEMFQPPVPFAMPLPPRSLDHRTCVTPTLSDAVPAIDISGEEYCGLAMLGYVMVTVGRVGSDEDVVEVTDSVSVPWLPAASTAVIVITLVPPCSGIPDTVQLVVPFATPLPPRSLDHRTCETPTLSDAMPPSVMAEEDVEYVAAEVGALMVAVGGVVSPPVPVEVIVHVKL
jgi:hypothetical protein